MGHSGTVEAPIPVRDVLLYVAASISGTVRSLWETRVGDTLAQGWQKEGASLTIHELPH